MSYFLIARVEKARKGGGGGGERERKREREKERKSVCVRVTWVDSVRKGARREKRGHTKEKKMLYMLVKRQSTIRSRGNYEIALVKRRRGKGEGEGGSCYGR